MHCSQLYLLLWGFISFAGLPFGAYIIYQFMCRYYLRKWYHSLMKLDYMWKTGGRISFVFMLLALSIIAVLYHAALSPSLIIDVAQTRNKNKQKQ